MDFETDQQRILEIIRESFSNGTVAGFYAPSTLGRGIFITSVEGIAACNGDLEIILKEYDTSGYILPKKRVKLGEIEKVFPFQSQMANPFMKTLTGTRFHRIID